MRHDRFDSMNGRSGVLFVFIVVLLLTASQSARARPTGDDDQAKSLLEQMAATMRSAKTLEAQMEIIYTRTDKLSGPNVERSKGTMRLRKPNLALLESNASPPCVCGIAPAPLPMN